MIKNLQGALNKILLGKEDVIKLAISCLLAEGHLLLEDIPGVGKTTLSHALALLTGLEYRRIQFTSDLLPSDLIGVSIFNANKQSFKFHSGPLFSQLVLADEINRATPRTQSALLEAMEEQQVTTDAGTHHLPSPFFVIATQNPMYQIGTYPLPESQLDRFLMCLSIGYPEVDAERKLLQKRKARDRLNDTKAIFNSDTLLTLQQKCLDVTVASPILDYVQNILKVSREGLWFNHGLSPRAGCSLVKAAKAYALVEQRDYVQVEDIQVVMAAVINHRLVIKKQDETQKPAELLLNNVEVPF